MTDCQGPRYEQAECRPWGFYHKLDSPVSSPLMYAMPKAAGK